MAPNFTEEKTYRGIAASPGFAIGKVLVVRDDSTSYSEPEDINISKDQTDAEIERFIAAIESTRLELSNLQRKLQNKIDARDASIFDAHLMIVEDQILMSEVTSMIRNNLKSAEYAFYKVIERYAIALSAMPDDYIKERAADIRDVASRILAHLQNCHKSGLANLQEQRIILSRDLTPSDTASLDREKILGFAIETGSRTCHTAILARSMQLPALVGIPEELIEELQNDDVVIIDGFSGSIIVNPSERTCELYQSKIEEESKIYSDFAKENRLRPETTDGFMVQLSANLESVADINMVKKFGACGIGLFRTEYLFMTSNKLPTEEEQFNIYKELLEGVNDEPVIVRTLDIGGDKMDLSLQRYAEANPFLGLRGIRLCLKDRIDILRTQLRALLRAGVYGQLRIMLPMISCVEEVIQVKAIITDLKTEMDARHIPYGQNIQLGAMIETPVAALMAEHLVQYVDFFSFGTNDLIQYTMAIDRSNERVAYLYQPTNPAILELIGRCTQIARKNNVWVSACGQMASDPRYTALLIGLGVHELSMPPAAIGPVRRVIRKLRMNEAVNAAQEALMCATAAESMEIANKLLEKVAPEIVSFVLRNFEN